MSNHIKSSPIADMKVGDIVTIEKKPNEAISLATLMMRAKALAHYWSQKRNEPFKIECTRITFPNPGIRVKRIK